MPQKHQKKHPSEFLNDIEEWSEKQYNPGYWIEGKIPPYIKHGGKLGGILLLITGTVLILLVSFVSDIILNAISAIIGTLLAIVGLKKVTTKKQ